jgi:hypothetical protein
MLSAFMYLGRTLEVDPIDGQNGNLLVNDASGGRLAPAVVCIRIDLEGVDQDGPFCPESFGEGLLELLPLGFKLVPDCVFVSAI